jgi:two-component system, chemotaxis family, protein-glutamate methylesterase/glutaminase
MTAQQLVVVGASWGGLEAIGRLLSGLRGELTPAMAVALHRAGDTGGDVLVRYLAARSPLPVREVDDKDDIEPGHVYVAPADYHLLVEAGHFALSTEGRVRFSRPSIDVLFETAADAFGEELVAVVLTGANDDGCRGARAVKEAGGRVLVQDPETAERPEMPRAVVEAGSADLVLPIEGICDELNRLVTA